MAKKMYWMWPQDIKNGRATVSGNPISRCLRRSGCRGARVDAGGFVHMWDGREWTLTMLPKRMKYWLIRWMEGKLVRTERFSLTAPATKEKADG